ncbi:MAG TPA: serine/threonine-protein kinase [Polyangiaceae bacterium]|jgi:serine/threonine-protein kinase|nr:serine/threonine-protein kinase [Polyangiaceae bacterium]
MPTPSPALQAARARLGEVVGGKWRLDALVAVGGCSAIYAATHANGHRVAMKVFDIELTDNPTAVAHFLREGRAANRIGHPGVVPVLDEGTTADGAPFLLMPLLEGETAQQRLSRSPDGLPAAEALGIVEAVLDVLVEAHGRGIVHRDLKPDNVFVEAGGRVRVLDFGIARVEGSLEATACGVVMGTPGFMAPEQARGRTEDVGPRTDVWATGALLYTLLTGRLLHDAPNPLASVIRAQSEPVAPAEVLLEGVSDAVAHVLDGALAFEASQRWMDATAMRWAVRAALDEARSARGTAGSCAGVAVDALAGRTATSDAPVAVDTPPWTGWTWPPMPWVAAACAAAMVALALLSTHSFTPGKAPVVASAPHAAEELPALASDAPPGEPTPAPPPPSVDVDDLPRATPPGAPHRAARPGPKATEIVRQVDF